MQITRAKLQKSGGVNIINTNSFIFFLPAMRRHINGEINIGKDNNLNGNNEIFDAFKEYDYQSGEYMKTLAISVFTRLAQYYYGTDGVADYSILTGEEAQIGNAAYIYTLITYEGNDLPVHIGNGEFNTEVFTRRNIPELIGFSHSPLPLFVVSAGDRDKIADNEPKIFFDDHALIYSPIGGEAELRISAKKRHPINYGERSGIMEYSDAIIALQNAVIHKVFPLEKSSTEKEKSFEKFIGKIEDLKGFSLEQLESRSNIKEGYKREDEHDEAFNKNIIACLWRLSDGNIKAMYKLVQSFDIPSQKFKPLPKKQKNS